MNIRPIRSDDDYRSAMGRIEWLMDVENPTPDQQDEIELLSLVIEDHERKSVPIDPPDPIEAIKFRMDQAGLTAADVAHCFGGRTRVYEVLNGQRGLTAAMMRALNEHLGIPADILLGRSAARLPEPSSHDWRRFPIREMMKIGWIPTVDSIADAGEALIEEFLAGARGGRCTTATPAFRLGSRENAKAEPYALMAWCCKAMALSSEDEPLSKAFDPGKVDPARFLGEIARLSHERNGPRRAVACMRENGIRFIVLTHLRKTYLDGAAMRGSDGVPLVAMTLRHDRLDNFWFCLMHELAHITLHLDDEPRVFLDDLSLRNVSDGSRAAEREREADELAERALIDEDVWARSGFPDAATDLRIAELAMEADVHPSVVAGRVRFETRNYRRFGGLIGNGEVRRIFPWEGVHTGTDGQRNRPGNDSRMDCRPPVSPDRREA